MYGRTYLPKEELEKLIGTNISSIDQNKIISAYEMADAAYGDKLMLDGTPYFFHTSRVAKIIISELKIFEPEIIISSLLHDIYHSTEEISSEIVQFNFGPYVTYLVEILKEDVQKLNKLPGSLDMGEGGKFRNPADDYLLIWMADHLDNFRCLDNNPNFNPINYIINVSSEFFPHAEKSSNPSVKYLMKELKKERNKILG
jgi:(p)ppGpp synthase/HD superfamily hydrolase